MIPILGALVLQAAYGAVDLLVVGRFGSTSRLSAVSTGSQVLNLVTFVVTQLAMGVTVACIVNIFGCLVFTLIWFKGDLLASFFSTDAAVIQNGFAYLKGFAPETIATAVLFSMIGYFNGNNKTLWVMLQGLIQTLCVRLPFAYFMSIQPNASLTRIGLAAPVSTTVGILLNVGFYLYLNKKEKRA